MVLTYKHISRPEKTNLGSDCLYIVAKSRRRCLIYTMVTLMRLRETQDLFFIVTSLAGSIVGCKPLVPGSIGTLVASSLNGHCPISFSALVWTHSLSGTTQFRKPQALSSTLVTLESLHPALGSLNCVVPLTRCLTYMYMYVALCIQVSSTIYSHVNVFRLVLHSLP